MSGWRSRREAWCACAVLVGFACADAGAGDGSGGATPSGGQPTRPTSAAGDAGSEQPSPSDESNSPDASTPSSGGPATDPPAPGSNPAGSGTTPEMTPAPSSGEPTGSTPSPTRPTPSASTPRETPSDDPRDPSNIPPGSGPLGLETDCNGADDDENGVIDDVDANEDGVCDCLAVATLGLHGAWGNGDVFSGWLSQRVGEITSLGDATLTRELLAPYHVLIIRDISPMNNAGLSYDQSEVEALHGWVRDGGGLMTLIGYSSSAEISNVNALLSAYSLRYGPDQIIPGEGAAAPITQWFEHPVSVGITRVGADNGYPVLGQGTTFAAQDGHDLGKAVIIGDGHVMVWGDEWISYEDEWRNDSQFQVAKFWQNALRWLTRANQCQVPAR